jgi:anhydro-N-acetylmuramic acid kinase
LTGHRELTAQQIQATLMALSVETAADAIEGHAPADAVVIACGGGTRNDALMRQLSTRLQRKISTTDEFGIDPQWVEPMAFAWLAMQTLSGRPGNLPAVTGAEGPRVLGAIHPGR